MTRAAWRSSFACWWRNGGHLFSILNLEPGRAWLGCAYCDARTPGWDVPDRIRPLHQQKGFMRILLEVVERSERNGGETRVTLNAVASMSRCSLVVYEYGERLGLGERFELTLDRIVSAKLPEGMTARLAIGGATKGGKATADTQ